MTPTYPACAKINLWLRVFASDDSEYHSLDTLFCAIDWCDRIEIDYDPELTIEVTGASLGPPEENLAFRAAREFYGALGQPPHGAISLQKVIPTGAGLGGGSSDAATVLRALQQMHDYPLTNAELSALALRLGSDVPFFLSDAVLARAGGRGERLEAVVPPLPSRPIVVVVPNFGISTRAAYRWLDESGALRPAVAAWPPPSNWEDVEKRAYNSFESVLFTRYPELLQIRDELRRHGATISMVSGSGSAVFGIFASHDVAELAYLAMLMGKRNLQVYLGRTLENRAD
jgi:4-diphosphocytidyl-2-C-methyl-D-erythritol kinase